MIGLEIKPKKGLKALQLVRIQAPIAPDQSEDPDGVIFRVDPAELVTRKVMGKLEVRAQSSLWQAPRPSPPRRPSPRRRCAPQICHLWSGRWTTASSRSCAPR